MGPGKSKAVKPPAIKFEFAGSVDTEKLDDQSKKLYSQVDEAILAQTEPLLDSISKYAGCEEPIRKALNEPGPKNEGAAWEAVSKAVDKLHDFYQLSLQLDQLWPQVLQSVCGVVPLDGVRDHLALTKQLALIFDFVFHFDEAKLINPAIQNDFSYYRRVLSRMKDKKTKMKVDEELANKMSFFFAYPTPMMKVMIDTTSANKGDVPRLIGGLSTIANMCLANITHNTATASGNKDILFLCCMTGCIILVDHLRNPEGAFDKKSPIMIRECIALLKTGTQQNTDFLLNSLRFTTLHLNDDTTMPQIKKLLS